jgi:hydrogenase maturation protein HypF
MLPANPLQHLLMMDCQRPLVMTSGNLSGKPPAIHQCKRWTTSGILPTVFCCITATSCNGWMIPWWIGWRYAAPCARFCAGCHHVACRIHHIPAMLCLGAEMKNTFCLVRGNQAVLSQHFGDLSDDGVEHQWRSRCR